VTTGEHAATAAALLPARAGRDDALDAESLHRLGGEALQHGAPERAIEYLLRAVERDGLQARYFSTLGSACLAAGRPQEAITCYQHAIALAPDNAEAHFNLGNVLQSTGDAARAVESYRLAIEHHPHFAKAHFNLANAHLVGNQLAEAQKSFEFALRLNPSFAAPAHANLGLVMWRHGALDDAQRQCALALKADEAYAAAHVLQGNIRKDRGQFAEAAASYGRAIALDPNNHDAHNNLGLVRQQAKEHEAARRCYERALELRPDDADAHNNLGTLLHEEGCIEAAIAHYRAALQSRPDFAGALTNLGMALDQQGAGDESLALLARALELDPHHADARFYQAVARLRRGDFAGGWRDYEARWRRPDMKPRAIPAPEWDGSSLSGRTILVHAEQGVGDEVFFASCLPDLLRVADRCVLECEPRLAPLFARSFPREVVAPRSPRDPAAWRGQIDVQIPLGSLPRFFRNSEREFPAARGYLVADPVRTGQWQARLSSLGAGIKVGISWRGGSAPEDRRRRSTTLDQWTPLFNVPGANFVNLQYGNVGAELAALQPRAVHHWPDSDPLRDLDDFAALLSALDLVISVDNAAVHLAGALGRPVWILLPHAADWRWMRDRNDSLWYPSARLMRQPRPGDWGSVMESAARLLASFAPAAERDALPIAERRVLDANLE